MISFRRIVNLPIEFDTLARTLIQFAQDPDKLPKRASGPVSFCQSDLKLDHRPIVVLYSFKSGSTTKDLLTNVLVAVVSAIHFAALIAEPTSCTTVQVRKVMSFYKQRE